MTNIIRLNQETYADSEDRIVDLFGDETIGESMMTESNGLSINHWSNTTSEIGLTERTIPEPPLPPVTQQNANLLLKYLDHVYSWQFRCDLIQTPPIQKDWLLCLILQNRPLYLAVLALSESHISLTSLHNFDPKISTDGPSSLCRYFEAIQELQLFVPQYQSTQLLGEEKDPAHILFSIVMLLYLNVRLLFQ
jgi:hypothetical protein